MCKTRRHDSDTLCGPSERMVVHMALDYVSIGLRIKHARTSKNMSQEQLAETLSISRTQLAYLETGARGPSLELLIDISNVLETPISDLLADHLKNSDVSTDTDLHYILLDCSRQQEKIITKMAQALKAILLEQGI